MATEAKEPRVLVPEAGPGNRPFSSPWTHSPRVDDVPARRISPHEGVIVRKSFGRRWRVAIFVIALGLLAGVLCGGRKDAGWFAAWGDSLLARGPSSTVLPAEAELTNSLGMKLVLIAPGVFVMGSANADDDWDGDEKPHRVLITRPFYLAAHEVTVGQFRRFVEETGYVTDAERSLKYQSEGRGFPNLFEQKKRVSWREPGFPQGDNHPVVQVSWNDAQAFIEWLSGIEKREYRQPRESEWEYACRAGCTARFSMGDDEQSVRKAENLWDAGPERGFAPEGPRDGFRFTSPVGSFPANGFGLHDMHGNVREWCADWYQDDYYRESPSADPEGPAWGSQRVTRGGSFFLDPLRDRSASRAAEPPSFHFYDLGFRVALTPR
jgi:formylglycine-generating enzyme